VLFLAVDDLRDWIGCLHTYPGVQTPNIDRLAARGTLFRHAYCAAPLCNPSRAALLLGIPPHASGVYGNDQDWRLRDRGACELAGPLPVAGVASARAARSSTMRTTTKPRSTSTSTAA
jgi:arylsulfatase A-like enzyme